MKNPFSPNKSFVNTPNRNAFDLSHSNNLTFNFGQLIPCLCLETLPGDSFDIDAATALRFMPLAFPIQTKCKAYVHFFYQRLKNLWKDAPDFLYGNDVLFNDKLESPFIDFKIPENLDLLRTGSLGDYLGLPTVQNNSSFNNLQLQGFPLLDTRLISYEPSYGFPSSHDADPIDSPYHYLDPSSSSSTQDGTLYPDRSTFGLSLFKWIPSFDDIHSPTFNTVPYTVNVSIDYPSGVSFDPNTVQGCIYVIEQDGSLTFPSFYACKVESIERVTNGDDSERYTRVTFSFDYSESRYAQVNAAIGIVGRFTSYDVSNVPIITLSSSGKYATDAVSTPFGSPLADGTKYRISSLPFRCYESIYNAFYRDNRNNPLIAGGQPLYNRYLKYDGGSSDKNLFKIYNRNWEYDQFTSAVQSPQQGVAPLVGISSTGDVTFQSDGKSYTFSTETADDADTITKVNVTEGAPDTVLKSAMNLATQGISINDFRNVNAFQRWLETNIRRGLKYKDQTLARWGVEPRDSTLDMPEFIGGFSVDVDINTVTNTSAGSGAVLGDYAAQAFAFGGSKHKIHQYCDQHGFIMAIISVVPTPVYTQTLPKMFLRDSALDYYSPEFGQIGLQAVKYKELCPLELQEYESGAATVGRETTFGYQRPWYDYLYALDTAHGLFRTDFNQFILSRVFNRPPTLGPDFLTVKDSSLNDVFSVKNNNNILGMVRFNIVAKRPIPSVSVPTL